MTEYSMQRRRHNGAVELRAESMQAADEFDLAARASAGRALRRDRCRATMARVVEHDMERRAVQRRAWVALANAISQREYEASDLYDEVDMDEG